MTIRRRCMPTRTPAPPPRKTITATSFQPPFPPRFRGAFLCAAIIHHFVDHTNDNAVYDTAMTPQRIKSIRAALGENTAQFGRRFARSGRTVEDWEQGRRQPDPLVITLLEALEEKINKSEINT